MHCRRELTIALDFIAACMIAQLFLDRWLADAREGLAFESLACPRLASGARVGSLRERGDHSNLPVPVSHNRHIN
jgi:hypothetical protein